MKRNLLLLFSLVTFGLGLAQKNKFDDVTNSRKLGMMVKNVKSGDKADYFQQYYWLVKAEQLKQYPHLQGIKPVVFYQFVKEIYPAYTTKSLEPKYQELRDKADLSLTQYFTKKDFANPLVMANLEAYVDPSNSKYFTGVNPEKVKMLVNKKLYTFTSVNTRTNEEKTYYLWLDDDKFKIVNIFPDATHKDFQASLDRWMPKFNISKFTPTVVMGDKKDSKDVDYFYITPFQEGTDNIIYKTKDFKEFELVSYKRNGEPWSDIRKKP